MRTKKPDEEPFEIMLIPMIDCLLVIIIFFLVATTLKNRAKELPLAGQVAVITGAGGAIGFATAKAFAAAGCEVALLDVSETEFVSAPEVVQASE